MRGQSARHETHQAACMQRSWEPATGERASSAPETSAASVLAPLKRWKFQNMKHRPRAASAERGQDKRARGSRERLDGCCTEQSRPWSTAASTSKQQQDCLAVPRSPVGSPAAPKKSTESSQKSEGNSRTTWQAACGAGTGGGVESSALLNCLPADLLTAQPTTPSSPSLPPLPLLSLSPPVSLSPPLAHSPC